MGWYTIKTNQSISQFTDKGNCEESWSAKSWKDKAICIFYEKICENIFLSQSVLPL